MATNGDSLHEIDRKTGIDNSGMSRKFREGRSLSAEQVIAVALGYNLDPVQALADTGYLPKPDTAPPTMQQLARQLRQIANELEKIAPTENNVFEFPTNVSSAIYNDMPDHAAAYGHDDLDQWEENDDTP